MHTFGREINRTVDTLDLNIFQGSTPSCAVRSQEIIMRDYGIQIPQQELMDFAEQKGWYIPDPTNGGTPPGDIGKLLETCGISTNTSYENSVYDLVKELDSGHRVIVTVDSRELWAEPGSEEWEFYRNVKNADHALIVAGVKVDPSDVQNSSVILTDPGRGDAFIEYDMKDFVHSWKDSNFYMMTTTEPAPYQYNEITESMEYSNFATDYAIAEFPFHNDFDSIYSINHDGEYNPLYSDGSIFNIAGTISSEDFAEILTSNSYERLEELFSLDDDISAFDDFDESVFDA